MSFTWKISCNCITFIAFGLSKYLGTLQHLLFWSSSRILVKRNFPKTKHFLAIPHGHHQSNMACNMAQLCLIWTIWYEKNVAFHECGTWSALKTGWRVSFWDHCLLWVHCCIFIRFFGFLIFPLVDIWRPFSTLHLFIRVTMSYAAESLRCWHARRGALLDRVFLLSRMQYPYTLCWSFGGSIVIECLKAPRGLGWSWRRSFTRFKAQSFMCFEDNLLQIILQWYFLNVW